MGTLTTAFAIPATCSQRWTTLRQTLASLLFPPPLPPLRNPPLPPLLRQPTLPPLLLLRRPLPRLPLTHVTLPLLLASVILFTAVSSLVPPTHPLLRQPSSTSTVSAMQAICCMTIVLT